MSFSDLYPRDTADLYSTFDHQFPGWADNKTCNFTAIIIASFTTPLLWPHLARLSDESLCTLEYTLTNGDTSSYTNLRRALANMTLEQRVSFLTNFFAEHLP